MKPSALSPGSTVAVCSRRSALLPAVSGLLLPISAPAQTCDVGQRAAVVE